MSTSIVLTVVSDDRPGIVEALSKVLTDHQGNWAESSMMALAGKFAGILLVQLPDGQAGSFIAAVEALESSGLQIVAKRSDAKPVAKTDTNREYTIELVGQDHPGIVHDITGVLTRHGINVQELETTVQSASMSGESLFIAHATIFVPRDVSMERLQDEMEALANELMVDITLED